MTLFDLSGDHIVAVGGDAVAVDTPTDLEGHPIELRSGEIEPARLTPWEYAGSVAMRASEAQSQAHDLGGLVVRGVGGYRFHT